MKVTKEMLAEMRRWGSAEQDELEALLDERKALRAALVYVLPVPVGEAAVYAALALGEDEE